MKYLSKILFACMLLCVSLAANAVDEVIITASPIPDYQTPMPTAGTFMGVAAQGTAQQAGQAAARQNCLMGVAEIIGDDCKSKANLIKDAELNRCSRMAEGGGIFAALSAAAFAFGPAGWVAGTLFLVGVGGGTAVGLHGGFTCRDEATSNFDYNLGTACPLGIKQAQDKNCPQP